MSESIIETVRSRYGTIADSGFSSDQAGVQAVALAFGYTPEELTSIPAEANLGVSCGNPLATANLREGETVVDLGSGGGLDVFLAASKVGLMGRAIGIDMTPEMISLARRNASKIQGDTSNIEFYQATIDHLPLADDTVDCVISNCVINLAPDKKAVFREIARILKKGGRLAISDIVLKRQLPQEVKNNMPAYVNCVAGAITRDNYPQWLINEGFSNVIILESGTDLNAYALIDDQSSCCTSELNQVPGGEPKDPHSQVNVNDYAMSVKIFAVKPE